MGSASSETVLIMRATWGLYKNCLRDALNNALRNWWIVFVQLGYYLIFVVASQIAYLFGTLIGGLMLGLLSAFLAANYFSLILCCISGERIRLREIWSGSRELFGPVLNVLFVFYFLTLIFQTAFHGAQWEHFRALFSLAVVLLLNPLPEALYILRGGVWQTISESVVFVRDNTIEWFLPLAALLLPVIVPNPKSFLLLLSSANPLLIGDFFIVHFGSIGSVRLGAPSVLLMLCGLALAFFVMVFRGMLFQRLHLSSRRKRVFEERMGK